MPIPTYEDFMRPLLEFAADGQEKSIRAAIPALAQRFGLTDEERSTLLASGKQTVLANRVHWAGTYLRKAGVLQRTRRSHFTITDRGRALLADHKGPIDGSVLRHFPEFLEFVKGGGTGNGSDADESDPQLILDTQKAPLREVTPEEAIQSAEATLNAALRTQLLDRIREETPAFFERLVVDLIVAMGYGDTRHRVAEKLGRSGDEGIDGLVNEDPLGLDIVYLQAKRYAADNTVGRERIQQFAGALVGQGASKGVFVTTSSFSRNAIEYAQRVPQRIILIDGAELTRLMVQYGVAVRTERVIEIKRMDLDYFDEAGD